MDVDGGDSRFLACDMIGKNSPCSLCSRKIAARDIIFDLIYWLIRCLLYLFSEGETGAIRTLEQILIEVHENVDRKADIHIHMTVHKLGKARHVADHPTVILRCSTINHATITIHRSSRVQIEWEAESAATALVTAAMASIQVILRMHIEL